MPVISPSAFAPPVVPGPPTIGNPARGRSAREDPPAGARPQRPAGRPGRRAARRAGDRRPAARRRVADRRPARDRGGTRPLRPRRLPRWRGAGLCRPSAGPLRGEVPRHPAVVPPPVGHVRCAALCRRALRLVRSGAPADGHGAARRGSVLGDGRGPALSRHRRRAGRDARRRSHRRPPPVARRREERRARPAAALPAGADAKRVHDALAHRLGAVALDARPQRHRRRALAPPAQTQPLRRAVRRRNPVLARGVER